MGRKLKVLCFNSILQIVRSGRPFAGREGVPKIYGRFINGKNPKTRFNTRARFGHASDYSTPCSASGRSSSGANASGSQRNAAAGQGKNLQGNDREERRDLSPEDCQSQLPTR